jgi:hypothetical protein
MENFWDIQEQGNSLMPRFIDSKYVAENIDNPSMEMEFIPIQRKQLLELRNNVSEALITPDSKSLLNDEMERIPLNYGSWMYFPLRKKCIQILPESDFFELRTSRNRLKITREEQLQLSSKSIAIIGLSAGNAVANALASERICGKIFLFDFDACELSNLNRLNAGIFDLGLNKCIIAANNILEKDPYIVVQIFESGFLNSEAHSKVIAEVDLVVDECDSFDVKILLRNLAKKFQKPILMHTSERGITDIERFDLDGNLQIFHGLLNGIDLSDKRQVLIALINPSIVSERMLLSFSEIGKSLKSWPQLASEVFSGGANLAGIARMIILGQVVNGGRYFFNTEDVAS